ncbi:MULTISPECIES: MBOAT family protein [Nostoc]|uniref:MBOAT family protein n=1 Tax=Nostoc paludosum FACHB-159 TaxID=2692908 RepID=A0ABR8K554_9NOSO|nr:MULTISPECIES: MBOAT family protein [Nostoc]MBD2677421.1 MBOAT family protein [Nostoc sp. FACHB-857]MBD2734185.1 MBOAT family protein [Nostoc paludosum FACHB-159]
MVFTEFRFLWFFLVVFCVYWGLQNNNHRKFWLLVCSYIFYGAWDWRFLFLLLLSTVVDYVVGLMLSRPKVNSSATKPEITASEVIENPDSKQGWSSLFSGNILLNKPIDQNQRRVWLLVSLVINLGLLGFFKYYNFFTDSASHLLAFLGLPVSIKTLEIILPAGISFYTFQTLSYSIDVYLGTLKPVKNFGDFALFVTFFPQLVAGPIVRASDFLPQLLNTKTLNKVDFRGSLILFMVGYFKKACISDNLSPLVEQYFANPESYTALSCWVAVISFVIQIYCDFSGYSDMAIASAGLLGYKLTLNFNFPYLADNITDLWQRWHISLYSWLRDYIYFPLMKMRPKNQRTELFRSRNILILMLVSGLWHGAAWHFVTWGGLNGIALIVHRQWSSWIAPYKVLLPIRKTLGIPLTFYWFCASAIFFRSNDINSAVQIEKAFLFFHSSGYENVNLQLAWFFIPLAILHWSAYKGWLTHWTEKIPNWSFAAFYGVLSAIILRLMAVNPQPFVYFQF